MCRDAGPGKWRASKDIGRRARAWKLKVHCSPQPVSAVLGMAPPSDSQPENLLGLGPWQAQPASLSPPTFPLSLLPPSTALVPFDDFPKWRSRWPLDAPERNFLLTISLPPGLGKELVDVITPLRAGPGRNRKMDNFHSGGKKCSYFFSWLQSSCDSQ